MKERGGSGEQKRFRKIWGLLRVPSLSSRVLIAAHAEAGKLWDHPAKAQWGGLPGLLQAVCISL